MAKQTRRFIPRLEAFDDRCLPSVTFNEVPNGDPMNPNTSWTLQVQGDDGANNIAISDDGTALAGAVAITADLQATYFSQHTISQIQVFTFGGNDVVDYSLAGDMVVSRTLSVDVGLKNDTFNAHLGNCVIGGQADVNGLYPAVDFIISVSGGAGSDRFNVDAANHVNRRASLAINLVGSKGKDVFTTNYSVTTDPADGLNPAGFFLPSQTQ